MGTVQEYYDQYYTSGKTKLDQQYTVKQETTAKTLEQINAALDQAAATATAGYQQSIEQAPLDALEQKEDNALREAINRKIVSENMANMGITDSGLNRTQQTALTLQRGNADAEVDRQTQEYVNQLQLAIDEVMSNTEKQKAQYKIEAESADSDWFNAALLELENNAQGYATQMYTADQEAAATIAAAQIEAQQKQSENITSYITKRMAEGVSYDVAAMEAYAVYGTGDEAVDTQNRNYVTTYQKAINAGYDETQAAIVAENYKKTGNWDTAVASAAVSGGNLVTLYDGLNAFGRFSADYGNSAEYQAQRWDDVDDWKGVLDRMIKKATENLNATGHALSDTAKQYAVAEAVGTAIKAAVTEDNIQIIKSALSSEFSKEALDAAESAAGIPKNYISHADVEKTLKGLFGFK